jgi:hypothetical protein
MGGFLQSVLQGIGRTGADAAGGRLEAEDRKLKMLQSQMELSQLKQKLGMEAAPQYVGSYADPTGRRMNTTRNPFTGALSDQPGGQEAPKGTWKPLLQESGDYVEYNDVTGESRSMKDQKGNVIRGFPKGKDGQPVIIDGKPAGVFRAGRPITPSDPEWTDADAVKLASYLKTYSEAEEGKNKRIKLAADSRVEAFMRTREYGAMDAATGALVYVTPDQMRKSPGRYAPPGPAVQAKNRAAIFNEIDTTKAFLNDAIAKLPDDAFSPEARLQIAYAMRDEDPKSAWHNFLNSDVSATLTTEQINYVTSLVSMEESAMSLRSLGGMGAGSDMLRNQILKMLPGAGTPSKAYAVRQVKIFDGELQALKTSVPNIGEPGQGGGATAPQGGTVPPPGSTIIRWNPQTGVK